MIATSAQSLPEVTPAPFGPDPQQTLIVVNQVYQQLIEMLVEAPGDIGAKGVLAQCTQSLLCLSVAGRIEHLVNQKQTVLVAPVFAPILRQPLSAR